MGKKSDKKLVWSDRGDRFKLAFMSCAKNKPHIRLTPFHSPVQTDGLFSHFPSNWRITSKVSLKENLRIILIEICMYVWSEFPEFKRKRDGRAAGEKSKVTRNSSWTLDFSHSP
jgi:hypothetical protein